jgi:hypothetical protein
MDEYVNKFLEFTRYVPYIKDEIQRYNNSLVDHLNPFKTKLILMNLRL